MRLLLPLIALAAVLPFVESVSAQPKAEVRKGKKIAVLVGVNEYLNKPLENLKYAEQDMIELKEKLEKAGFTVIMLLGSGTGDAEASRKNIHATLIDKREENPTFAFRDVTSEEDTILIAFSGHGEQIEIDEADDEGKKAQREVPFFCPKRAESGKPSTQVSLNEVLRTFNGGKAKALLLVDACRSYAKNLESTKGAVIDRKRVDSLRPNVAGMFACSDRQRAIESPGAGAKGHGLFFYGVLQAMDHEKSRDGEGNVVWTRMVDEIADTVQAKSKELFPNMADDYRQVPQPFGGFSRKFVLVAAAAAGEPKAGEVRKFEVAAGVFMEFCYIPKGKATLGSPKEEKDRGEDEKEHEYEEKAGFWLGKYTVTQGEWTGVMGKNPSYFVPTEATVKKAGIADTTRFPAEQVSWDDICGKLGAGGDDTFLGKLNARAGVVKAFGGKAKFVLPHEDRWEYACRGGKGNKQAYYWGNELTKAEANFGNNVGRTTAVGEYEKAAKHPWGLCDMSGNVFQWCDNLYSTSSTSRVLRGGSWYSFPVYCRAAFRNGLAPADRYDIVGFRLCAVLD